MEVTDPDVMIKWAQEWWLPIDWCKTFFKQLL